MHVLEKQLEDGTLNMPLPTFLTITLLGSAAVAELILYTAS